MTCDFWAAFNVQRNFFTNYILKVYWYIKYSRELVQWPVISGLRSTCNVISLQTTYSKYTGTSSIVVSLSSDLWFLGCVQRATCSRVFCPWYLLLLVLIIWYRNPRAKRSLSLCTSKTYKPNPGFNFLFDVIQVGTRSLSIDTLY